MLEMFFSGYKILGILLENKYENYPSNVFVSVEECVIETILKYIIISKKLEIKLTLFHIYLSRIWIPQTIMFLLP